MELRHICEVCGVEQILTPDVAFEAGWDYPPRMGQYGIVSPRTCPSCPMIKTIYWAIAMDHYTADMLTAQQQAVLRRIMREPGSITVPPAEA